MSTKRRFDAKFKRKAVEMTCGSDMTVEEVAEELGISANLLSRWRKELLGVRRTPPRKISERGLRRQLEEAEAEIEQLNNEIDFLKKATAYFEKMKKDEKQ